MAWQDEMVPILRALIDDMGATQYSDTRLENILLASAELVIVEADFDNSYVITISSSTLTPDPTTGTKDNNFITLVCLKAACIIASSELRLAAKKGLSIKDGPSTIDGKGVSVGAKVWAEEACKRYSDARKMHATTGTVGKAIVGPYRLQTTNLINYR